MKRRPESRRPEKRRRERARLVGALGLCAAVVAVSASGVAGASDIRDKPLTAVKPGQFQFSSALAPGSPAIAGYRLTFNPSFAGTRLNKKIWATCYPWNNPVIGCTNHGHTEYEWYLPSQVRVYGGVLHLVAKAIKTLGTHKDGLPEVFPCRSGMVTTYPGFNFEYGVIQVVAKISGSTGMWPALWLAPSNRSWPPEVDMLEYFFGKRRLEATFLHPAPASANRISGWPFTANLTVGWHTYTMAWTANTMTFYQDGQVVLITHGGVPHEKLYFIANLADAGQPGRAGCSGSVELRSVKVWQN